MFRLVANLGPSLNRGDRHAVIPMPLEQSCVIPLGTTRNAPAFISAFEKLANQNLSELEPEPWVEWLLYDHPAIAKRLAMGRAYMAHSAEIASM